MQFEDVASFAWLLLSDIADAGDDVSCTDDLVFGSPAAVVVVVVIAADLLRISAGHATIEQLVKLFHENVNEIVYLNNVHYILNRSVTNTGKPEHHTTKNVTAELVWFANSPPWLSAKRLDE